MNSQPKPETMKEKLKITFKRESEIYTNALGIQFFQEGISHPILFTAEETNESVLRAEYICKSVNEYPELAQRNKELTEALKDIIHCQFSPMKTLANLNGAIANAQQLLKTSD